MDAASSEKPALATKSVTQSHSEKTPRHLPPEILTDDEVQRLIRSCSSRYPTGIRNRALVAVLYRAGLRVAEALALLPKDLDAANGTVRVLKGKGCKARTVGMDAGAFALVARWMEKRAELGIGRAAPLFCTLKGGKVSGAYFRAALKRIAAKAGIEKRVHAHGLRHTHAAQLRQEGVDIGVISKQLGHRSIVTTVRYLDHVAPQSVVDAMRGRKWEAK